MLLLSLLLVPLLGIMLISIFYTSTNTINSGLIQIYNLELCTKNAKTIALITSIINLLISLVIFMLFDFSFNQFQFVQEPHSINGYTLYLGLDGISIYFVLLTTIIVPIALLSN
jgi:NADH:ubiquinone oxidoreductase subunit 4 (subunit M)